ncbi:MAG: hypothetical protein PHG58_05200 [Clostridia bacterium]|nr:hypothetical protein [Clostridia bacterium]
MNRITKCITFQIKAMAMSSAIFLVIYIAATLVLASLLLVASESTSGGSTISLSSVSSGFYIGAGIFIFVYVIAAYKETFNYLLMFGNTRKNILLSTVVTSAVMSLAFSAISLIIFQVEGAISKLSDFSSYSSVNLINLIYKDSGIFSEFLWLTAFFFLICSFSLLYSTLAYKFGSIFISLFWVCFGLSFIGLPILWDMNSFKVLDEALTSFFRIGSEHGILLAPVNFVAASAIFSAVAYLASRRQPQSA